MKIILLCLTFALVSCGKSSGGRSNKKPIAEEDGGGKTDTAEQFADFDSYAGKVSFDTLNQRLNDVLLGSADVNELYNLNPSKFELFASLANKNAGQSDISLELGESTPLSKPYYAFSGTDATLPLKGLKVALDPKYIGGPLAIKAEKRYVRYTTGTDEEILFSEADINLYIAKIIKLKLERWGATVLLSRNYKSENVFAKDFATWRAEDFENELRERFAGITNPEQYKNIIDQWLNKTDDEQIYENFYLDHDLKARALKINEFEPNLTVRIGLGLGSKFDENKQTIPTNLNAGVLFLAGGYHKIDLRKASARLTFMRFLLTPILNDTLRISNSIGSSMGNATQIYPIDKSSLPIDHPLVSSYKNVIGGPGTFAKVDIFLERTLAPVIDFEAVFQDNAQESIKLATGLKEVERLELTGLPLDNKTNRLYQIANGYANGIYFFYAN